jgi:creatinine amidohydrolase
MNLLTSTSDEVAEYLRHCPGVIVPIGSIEQHGPIGLVGTDALCAETIAKEAGSVGNILIAPTLCYTPAQFNMAFPGTVSITVRTLMALIQDIVDSFHRQGIKRIYFLNAHGANLMAIKGATHDIYNRLGEQSPLVRCKSWWDFESVNAIRTEEFGEWEGLHATPSEISITQSEYRSVQSPSTMKRPTSALTAQFIVDHAGDFHPPASQHKAEFPDGRVGADSSLADAEIGARIIKAASTALIEDFRYFMKSLED